MLNLVRNDQTVFFAVVGRLDTSVSNCTGNVWNRSQFLLNMTQIPLVLVTESLLHCGEPCGRIEHRGVNTSVNSIVSPHNLDSLPLISCDFPLINLCHDTSHRTPMHTTRCTSVAGQLGHHIIIRFSEHYLKHITMCVCVCVCVFISLFMYMCVFCLSVYSSSGFYFLTSGERRWKVQKTIMLLYD